MRARPATTIEVDVSFRLHDTAGPCAYVTAIVERTDGVRSMVASRHITGSPERIVDLALTYCRELALEEFLTLCEPF